MFTILPFWFATLALDDAVDGLEYEESTEDGQRPEVVSTGDASRSPDREDGVNKKQEPCEDRLDSSQHLAEAHSLHCAIASLRLCNNRRRHYTEVLRRWSVIV